MANAGLRQVEITASHAGAVHPVDVEARRRPSYFDVDSRRSSRLFPWISCLFVVANVVVFIVTMFVNNCPKNSGDCVARFLGRFSFQPMRENPLLGPSSFTLLKMGALDVEKVVHQNQGWRIIACIWLHGGVFHLLSNMLGLLFIGIPLEREFGFVRIGLLYIISGVGGSLLSALFAESNISVGASGALFGLLGGMLSELIMNWTIYKNKFAAFTALVAIIAINLAVGLLPRVDNFAHIGGFISGFLLGFIFLIRPHFGYINQKNLPSTHRPLSAARKHKLYQYILWILAAILLIIGFIVGFVLLYRGVDANKRCSWCRYLNCIPTSKWSCNQQAISCTVNSDPFQTILTCDRTGKSHTYPPQNSTKEQIKSLCAQLCS